MTRKLIAAVVGGLILFMWQFASWSALGIHKSQTQYTDKQDEILSALERIGLEEGQYALPMLPDNATKADQENYMKEINGNPWASLHYKKEWSNTMPLNLVRGLIMNILIVLGLCYFIGMMREPNFKNIMTVCLGFGLLAYLIEPYLFSIWFKTNTIPDLIDAVVQFGLLGAWLGFWLNRK